MWVCTKDEPLGKKREKRILTLITKFWLSSQNSGNKSKNWSQNSSQSSEIKVLRKKAELQEVKSFCSVALLLFCMWFCNRNKFKNLTITSLILFRTSLPNNNNNNINRITVWILGVKYSQKKDENMQQVAYSNLSFNFNY